MEQVQSKAWKAFFFAMVTVWLMAYAAVASIPPTDTVLYSAMYEWNGKPGYQIEVSRAKGAAPRDDVRAWIRTPSGQTQESCRVEQVSWNEAARPAPLSLDMECPSGHVAILWKSSQASQPTLRFGSWSDHYRDVKLTVERDAYSRARTASQIASTAGVSLTGR